MDLREFGYVIALAETGDLDGAAARAGTSPAALVSGMDAIEREVGTSLFERDGRAVALTADGCLLLEQARLVTALAARAGGQESLVRRAGGGGEHVGRAPWPPQALDIGITTNGLLPPGSEILEALRLRFPEAGVAVHRCSVPDTLAAVRTGALDGAFVLAPFPRIAGTGYVPLGALEVHVALPAAHPLAGFDRVAGAALGALPFLDWPSGVNPVLADHLRGRVFGPAGHPATIPSSDADMGRRLLFVAEGRGACTVTCPQINRLRIRGVVFRPLEERVRIEHGLVWRDPAGSAAARALVELARERSQAACG